MPVFLHHIATKVPDNHCDQKAVQETILATIEDNPYLRELADKMQSQTGIEKRHFIIPDFTPGNEYLYFSPENDRPASPSTHTRNNIFIEEGSKLYADVAAQLIDTSEGFSKEDITHVITVSCTGLFAPGPDHHIVRQLGLRKDTFRYHLGYMGCYAALPALNMAVSFCEADPNSVVLVVCVELCSLHFQVKKNINALLAATIFGDGAAGALVSAKPLKKAGYEFKQLHSQLCAKGDQDMTWTLTDTGMDIILTKYVPYIIESDIEEIVNPMLKEGQKKPEDIDHWALHPGGKAIIDKVEKKLNLPPAKISASRDILRNYGNMSSPTILFVLDRILNKSHSQNLDSVFGLAFGPGLTIEAVLLSIHK